MTITANEARKNLLSLIQQVNDDNAPVEITSRRGDAVLLSRAEYDALQETAYLLRVPTNARHLLDSLEQARNGRASSELTPHTLSRTLSGVFWRSSGLRWNVTALTIGE